METRSTVAKKRGRQKKTRNLQGGGESSRSIVDDTDHNGGASSSPGEVTVSRPLTRSANKKAALNTESRIPFQNPSEASTLLLVKQILLPSNTSPDMPNLAFPSKHPLQQAKDAESQNENICTADVIEAKKGETSSSDTKYQQPHGKNELDLQKFTLDLLAQAHQPNFPFEAVSPYLDEIMVNNNVLEREANVVANIFASKPEDTDNGTDQTDENLTPPTLSLNKNEIMSVPGNPFINFEGYEVKKEVVPVLKAVFKKHGDIVKENSFSTESRARLLELVCCIYKKLEAMTFMQLTTLDLESMLNQVADLELVKVNVGWLRKRLHQLSKSKQMYNGVMTLEDVPARSLLIINEKQKAVKTCEDELEAYMATVIKSIKKLQQEKDELAAAESAASLINIIFDGSLVHELV